MRLSRRSAIFSVAASMAQFPEPQITPEPGTPHSRDPDEDDKMPNGKSRRDAIASNDHKQALKEAGEMVTLANEIKAELDKAGDFVVPLATVKKTEQIEKLARQIRGRLRN